jgi:ADP-ribose pyrophosphatase YjhB (NUDIX family)
VRISSGTCGIRPLSTLAEVPDRPLPEGGVLRRSAEEPVIHGRGIDDGTVVLIRQFRHAAGGFIYEIPAGKLHPGEDPLRCAARELDRDEVLDVMEMPLSDAMDTIEDGTIRDAKTIGGVLAVYLRTNRG